MDGRTINHEAEIRAELAASYDAREAPRIRAELDAIRAEAERIARETIARGQAAGERGRTPAPQVPPCRPGGVRDRAAAPVRAGVVQIDAHHRFEMHPTRFALAARGLGERWVRISVSVSRAGIAAKAREKLGWSSELDAAIRSLPSHPPRVLASPFAPTTAPSVWR